VAAALRAAHSAGIAVTQGQFCFCFAPDDMLHRWGEVWRGIPHAKFHPHRCSGGGVRPQNTRATRCITANGKILKQSRDITILLLE